MNRFKTPPKEKVIRRVSCLQELYFFVFLLLTVYFGWNLLISAGEAGGKLSVLGLFLYLLLIPCLIFTAGYEFSILSAQEEDDRLRSRLLLRALLCLGLYVLFSMLPFKLAANMDLTDAFVYILRGTDIQPYAGIFLSLAVFYLLVSALRGPLKAIRFPAAVILSAVLLPLSLLRFRNGSYLIVDCLIGTTQEMRVFAVLPYTLYAFFGMWLGRRKYGFQLRGALLTAVATAVSLALYRTGLTALARVTLPAFPVYLIYGIGSLMTDSSRIHQRSARIAAASAGMFLADSVLFFVIRNVLGFSTGSVFKGLAVIVLIIAVSYGMLLLLYPVLNATEKVSAWFAEGGKHRTLVYFLLYTAVFTVFLLAYFFLFIYKRRSMIQTGDAVSQYYPRAAYFARYIRTFLSGLLHGHYELPMYDFHLGMGSEVTYILEPLYFLYALFGPDHVEFATGFLIVLRFYLSGMAFSAMALYFKKGYFAAFLGSLVYIFCGYTTTGVMIHWTFMVPMIIMPFMVIAAEEIMKRGKWYIMPLLVALFLYSNYYFFYMCTLGLAVYFLIRFFCQKDLCERTVGQFLRCGFTFAGTYLLGAALAALPLVTNFGFFFGSGRSQGSIINTPSLLYYGPQWILKCVMTFISQKDSPGEWLRLGYLPVVVLALVVLFANKGRKELKLLFLSCVVCMLFPVFAYISSGFNAVLNRWCFLLSLLMGYIVTDCLPDLLRMKRRDLWLSAAATGLYLYMARYGYLYRSRYMMVAAYLLLLTLGVFLLVQRSRSWISEAGTKLALTSLMLVLVFVNSWLYFGTAGMLREYLVPGETHRRVTTTPLEAVSSLDDDTFFRSGIARFPYNTINGSAILDYYGIYYFWSTLNGNIKDYISTLGIAGSSQTQLLGFSNHVLANAPACVKYYAQFDDEPFTRPLPYGYEYDRTVTVNGREVSLYRSDDALPIGYTYDTAVTEEELLQYSPLERQEVMIQSAVLADTGELPHAGDLVTDVVTLPITKVESSNVRLEDHSVTVYDPSSEEAGTAGAAASSVPNETLQLTFEGIADAETCLVLRNAHMDGTINDERVTITVRCGDETVSYRFPSSTFRYQIGQDDYVINLGYHKEALTGCTIQFESYCTIRFDAMELQALPMTHVKEWTAARKETVLEDVSIETNKVSGSIIADKDQLLVMSIPYQRGWTAYVDGTEVPLVKTNLMYIGLPISKGTHRVELRFDIKGVHYSYFVMAGAAAVYVLLLIVTRIRRRKSKQ